MKRKWRNTKIKWKMIILLALCWFVPVVIVSISVSMAVSGRLESQVGETVTNSMNKVVNLIESGFDDCHKESRNATYLGVVSDAYNAFLGSGDEQALYSDITMFLSEQYRYNKRTKSVMLFFVRNNELFYSTYSAGTSYENILRFKKEFMGDALKISEEINTYMYLYTGGGEIYIIRNLVSPNYTPFAVLLMQVDKKEMFASLESVWGYECAGVYVDGECVYGEDVFPINFNKVGESTAIYCRKDGEHYVYASDKLDGRLVTYVVKLDENVIMGEKYTGGYIILIFLLSMIPLGIIVFKFFDKTITEPINSLVNAAEQIGNENYGYQIEDGGSGREFIYLNGAFNKMSNKLKQQFEQIYLEELAVRDANIFALQSQINPHFINNTLEIINWEARLNGVYKVSGMIEALSTMLNATLNRKKVQTIPLSEEMEYVDAYLYIISERMGKRLTIEKNIDEKLMKETVPRLIAQPIIENAVEHGITTVGNGKVSISVYAEGSFMYMKVTNSGPLLPKDKEKVDAILSGNIDETKERSISIGISNVNKRLKLMYGEDCGLTIYGENDSTVSLLTFKREGGDLNA